MTWGEWAWFAQWESALYKHLTTQTIERQIAARPTGWELIQNKRQFPLGPYTEICVQTGSGK